MAPERTLVYFTADVHLGLSLGDPAGREARFVEFLRSIPADRTRALWLLGDIWDFWYEYRSVVPKGYVRVFAALTELMDAGVEVHFIPGNHDQWCYRYFAELGMKVEGQPCEVELDGRRFVLSHGDGLGPVPLSYRLLKGLFRCRVTRALFSTIHPTLALALGNAWSGGKKSSRRPYVFRGEDEPLYKWAAKYEAEAAAEGRKIDCFLCGHYHSGADLTLPGGARLMVLPSWLESSPYWYWDGISVFLGYSKNIEK